MGSDPYIDELVKSYGEQYRALIESTVKDVFIRALTNPRINLATYNFARHVAAVVFMNPVGHPHQF